MAGDLSLNTGMRIAIDLQGRLFSGQYHLFDQSGRNRTHVRIAVDQHGIDAPGCGSDQRGSIGNPDRNPSTEIERQTRNLTRYRERPGHELFIDCQHLSTLAGDRHQFDQTQLKLEPRDRTDKHRVGLRTQQFLHDFEPRFLSAVGQQC